MRKILIWWVLYYIRFFAKLSLSINKPKIIGITGSVGKSSARNVIYAILKDSFSVKMIKNGNSETGVPLGILELDPGSYKPLDWLRIIFLSPLKIFSLSGVKILIIEMGVDSPLPPKNMDYLLSIVRPNISVVLNAYPVHSEQFDNPEFNKLSPEKRTHLITKRIAEEKTKIIKVAKPLISIFNSDNSYIKEQLSDYKATELLSFGKESNNSVYYQNYKIDLEKTSFDLTINEIRSKKINIELKGYFLPEKYQEIISSGFLVGLSLGLTAEEIKKGLIKNFFLPKGRSSIFKGINNSVIIDSSYNSSRASMMTFLETGSKIAKKEKRPFVVLMGDMRELGNEAESEHKIIAELIKKNTDHFYCIGELTKKFVLPEISKKIKDSQWFGNSIKLGQFLQTRLPYHSLVLVKGSQNTIFLEETIKLILKNKEDKKKLCRQNKFWTDKKKIFFQGE